MSPSDLSQPFFSVIMPVYNGQAYVTHAIQSVLAQTNKSWELILIDDCSSDRTPEILAQFEEPRVRIFRNARNLNIAGSLNRGIQEARGKWMVRIDSDDYFTPEYLNILQPYAEAGLWQNSFCSTWVTCVDEEGKKIVDVRLPKSETIHRMMKMENFLYHPATSFSKALWEKVGGYPVKEKTIAEDTLLWIRFFDADAELVMIPQFLVNYRIHYSNITSVNDAKLYEAQDSREMKMIRQNREWRVSLYLKQEKLDLARAELVHLGRLQKYFSLKNIHYYILTFLPQSFVRFCMWELRPRMRALVKTLRGRSVRV